MSVNLFVPMKFSIYIIDTKFRHSQDSVIEKVFNYFGNVNIKRGNLIYLQFQYRLFSVLLLSASSSHRLAALQMLSFEKSERNKYQMVLITFVKVFLKAQG